MANKKRKDARKKDLPATPAMNAMGSDEGTSLMPRESEVDASGAQSGTRSMKEDSLWQTGDSNQKGLNLAFFLAGLVLWIVLIPFFNFLLDLVFTHLWVDSTLALTLERLPPPISVGFVLGALVAFGVGWYCRRNPQVNGFCLEVVMELKKVVWPAKDITAKSTVAVIITVMIFGALMGLFDFLLGGLASFIIN